MIWRTRTRDGHSITVNAPTKAYAKQQFDALYGKGNWGSELNCIRNDAGNYNMEGGSSSGSGGSGCGCLGLLLSIVLIFVMIGANEETTPTNNTNEVRREDVQ